MVMLAGTPGGLHRSTTGGALWQRVGSTDVSAIAEVAGAFIAGMGPTLFRSSDDGLTWTDVLTLGSTGTVSDFAFNGRALIAATSCGVFRSENRGLGWEKASTGLSQKYPATQVVLCGDYFLAAGKDGIYRISGEDGVWTFISSLAEVREMVYQRPCLYAAVTYDEFSPGQAPEVGVYRSTNGGVNWELLTAKQEKGEAGYTAVLVTGRHIYAGREDGAVFVSDDEGETWSQVVKGEPTMGTVHALFMEDGGLFACRDDGLYQSADRGASWKRSNTGIISYDVETFGLVGSEVLLPVGGILYRSADDGSTWENYCSGLGEATISCFATTENYVYVTSGEQVYRALKETRLPHVLPHSRNDELWQNITAPDVVVAKLHCAGACLFARIHIGNQQMTVHMSDRSPSWNSIGSLCFDAVTCFSNKLIAWGEERAGMNPHTERGHMAPGNEPPWRGLFESTNGGTRWSRVGKDYNGVMQIQCLKGCGPYLFGHGGSELYRSIDQGLSWTRLQPAPGLLQGVTSVGSNLIVATTAGLFQSTTYGGHWKNISDGLPAGAIPIELASTGTHLYVGTKHHGLFQRPLAQITDNNPHGKALDKVGASDLTTGYALGQNYPNPFNPVTTLTYSLPTAGHVVLAIYNVLGEQITVLAAGEHPSGTFTVSWDAAEYPSGVYFCRLTAGEVVQMRKMVLMR